MYKHWHSGARQIGCNCSSGVITTLGFWKVNGKQTRARNISVHLDPAPMPPSRRPRTRVLCGYDYVSYTYFIIPACD